MLCLCCEIEKLLVKVDVIEGARRRGDLDDDVEEI